MSQDQTAIVTNDVADRWLEKFEEYLTAQDAAGLASLFEEDIHWRDLLAFTWDIGWIAGSEAVSRQLLDAVGERRPTNIRRSERYGEPETVTRLLRQVLEVFVELETAHGNVISIVRLVPDTQSPVGARAWNLFTALEDLHGYEGVSLGARRADVGFDRSDSRVNWADRRAEAVAFETRDPEVLIVGGGQAGVMTAARLRELGVDSLIIDRLPRVGDNWRTRYKSLALHNETDVVHFAYMPMPTNYPQYIPKDKLANWIESYVEAMELNYWTSTEFLGGEYDETEKQWAVTIRKADGTERVMRPRHVVVATGGEGGTPKIPSLPGLESFSGEVLHTKQYRDGSDFSGKNVLVVGVATSAHDVAFDMYNHGADVTMLQRNPTVVINIDSANVLLSLYTQGKPTDQMDLVSSANFMYPLFLENLKAATVQTAQWDRELLEGLERAGMRLDQGEDESGYLMKFFRYKGGYYINVGASDAIARGDIAISQHEDIDSFVPDGLRMADGTVRQYDAVVLATGYINQQHEVRSLFGEDVAEKVGAIGGYDPETLEMKNMYTRTGQEGLWFMGGGISGCRIYSLYLALQIKAAELGVLPARSEADALSVGVS